jgi:hypothetical protein
MLRPRAAPCYAFAFRRAGTMKLDPVPLGNAVERLRAGLCRHQQDPADEQLRDGLIQRFEFAYELSHRMLRRALRDSAASPDEIERMPFADLIRTGNAQGLLRADWPAPRSRRPQTPAYNDI